MGEARYVGSEAKVEWMRGGMKGKHGAFHNQLALIYAVVRVGPRLRFGERQSQGWNPGPVDGKAHAFCAAVHFVT